MKPYILTLVAVVLLASSCETGSCNYFSKDRFLASYEKLVVKAKESERKVSDKAWERDDRKFETMATNCYPKFSEDMSYEEKATFWIDGAKYLYHRYGRSLITELSDPDTQEEIIRVVKEGAMEVFGTIQALIEAILKEIREAF